MGEDYDPSSPVKTYLQQLPESQEKKEAAVVAPDVSKLTYGEMISELFTTIFHKEKKHRDNGVTYQLIWKELEAKYPHTNKHQYLIRLKQITGKPSKFGILEKNEKGRFKFTTS